MTANFAHKGLLHDIRRVTIHCHYTPEGHKRLGVSPWRRFAALYSQGLVQRFTIVPTITQWTVLERQRSCSQPGSKGTIRNAEDICT